MQPVSAIHGGQIATNHQGDQYSKREDQQRPGSKCTGVRLRRTDDHRLFRGWWIGRFVCPVQPAGPVYQRNTPNFLTILELDAIFLNIVAPKIGSRHTVFTVCGVQQLLDVYPVDRMGRWDSGG